MSAIPSDVVKDLAPTGKLRAAINLGNTVLAQTDAATGKPKGITADLATELAKRLGVPLELPTFDAAGKVFDALKQNVWDIAFLAIEPARAAEIEFTAPYVLIEGVFMVPETSALKTPEDVDKPGVRIAVARGAAYDLYLTRNLKNAELVRSQKGADAWDMFLADKLEAAAGVRQPVTEFVKKHGGLRVIEPRFMAIRQAMGVPKGRLAGAKYFTGFIEEMKASGFVADALKRSNQPDAVVAPPGG